MRTLSAVLLLLAISAWGQTPEPASIAPVPVSTEEVTPLLVQPLAALRAARLSDRTVGLNYELELRAALSTPFSIERLEIVDPLHDDALIAALNADELKARIRLPGHKEPTLSLAPGDSGYLRINLTFAEFRAVPRFVDHRFTITAKFPPSTDPVTRVQRLARCQVDVQRPPTISPPVAGDHWVALGVSGTSGHRATTMPINGRWVTPERWGMDWIRLAPGNRLVTGDASKNESYPQYGQPLLAVADGRVVRTRDGMPDIPPGPLPPDMTIEKAGGNFVVLDIGHGYCAFYAHISPGTLRVHEGRWVRRGEVLGLLGNSGNTTAPHLHFHVNDDCLPLASDGVPYVLDRFRVEGTAVSADDLDSELQHPEVPVTVVPGSNAGTHTGEMPANLSVVSFGGRR